MKPDNIILTPNRRLSATLQRAHHAEAMQQGLGTWTTPAILPLQAWLQQCWQDCLLRTRSSDCPILLSPSQTLLLWERILAESPENTLLQSAATAELANKAWTLLKLWRIDIAHPDIALTEDGQAFQRWGTAFATHCENEGWVDAACLPDKLLDALNTGQVLLPKRLTLTGFTDIAPQLETLFDACRQLGCEVVTLDPEQRQSSAFQIRLADEDAEIRTMARWAKARLQEASSPETCRIGCIIPRLDTLRERVLQIFGETFSGQGILTATHSRLPFNLSAGKKLSDWPVIRTALLIMAATCRPLTDSEQARLQQSPFLVSLPASLQEPAPDRLPPSAWALQVSALLKAAGWPGKRSLSSDEYQIIQRWLALLNEYATFDLLQPEAGQREAFVALQRLAERTLFQPETPLAPVQISGILEAAGQSFDHLWIMGMDDTQWPFPPRPNPLIPLSLQRRLQMPHATAARELHYCQQLFEQLRGATTQLVCSHAGQQDDTPLRPASLLRDLPVLTAEDLMLSPYTSPAETVFASSVCETFVDEMAPPVTPEETLRGGSHILRHQAACPFRAFAEIRLHAKPTDPDTQGLAPKERGKLLHKALESFWQQVGDSTALNSLSPDSLRILTESVARNAMITCLQHSPEDSRYLHMEWERLVRLVLAWLEVEKNRPPFRVVACEQPLSLSLASLRLDLRMDRVDELEDGSHMILDYKTGKQASPLDWMGERPGEPQLPLYCISSPEKLSALAFATVHPETIRLSGLCAGETGIRGLRTLESWAKQVSEWDATLKKLAGEFSEGVARVDPRNGPQTCEHCHLQTLCRIHEMPEHVTG